MGNIYKGEIQGDLALSQGDDASAVTSIGGSLYVSEGATCDLPVCASIGGALEIKRRGKLNAPILETISGQPLRGEAERQGVAAR